MAKSVLLLTGDLHGRLSAEAETRIAELRAESKDTLLLDAGDAVEAGNLGPGSPKSPILIRMSALRYDAMAMGNRESHPFLDVLKRKLASASFPVLSANLMAKRRPAPGKVRSHVLKTLPNGMRFAIIGLSPQMTAPESWWSRVTDYIFDKAEKTATGLAAKLRPDVDVIVLLSHCGIATDRKLALIDGVDLVLGGHSHIELFERSEGAPILHSGYGGHTIGRIEVDLECEKITRIEGSILKLDEPKARRRR